MGEEPKPRKKRSLSKQKQKKLNSQDSSLQRRGESKSPNRANDKKKLNESGVTGKPAAEGSAKVRGMKLDAERPTKGGGEKPKTERPMENLGEKSEAEKPQEGVEQKPSALESDRIAVIPEAEGPAKGEIEEEKTKRSPEPETKKGGRDSVESLKPDNLEKSDKLSKSGSEKPEDLTVEKQDEKQEDQKGAEVVGDVKANVSEPRAESVGQAKEEEEVKEAEKEEEVPIKEQPSRSSSKMSGNEKPPAAEEIEEKSSPQKASHSPSPRRSPESLNQ